VNRAFWTDRRVAGSLLAGGLPITALALMILIASGALPASAVYLQGELAQAAPYVAASRTLFPLSALGWLVQTLGLGLLAGLLARTRHGQLGILTFSLVFVAAPLVALWATFRTSVELWFVQEAARAGSIPEIIEPLQAWTNGFFDVGTRAYHFAVAGSGLAMIRTGLLAPWVGWAAIGWSLLWLFAGLFGMGAPAIPVILPAALGFALLRGPATIG
jgi:hypothetical protein